LLCDSDEEKNEKKQVAKVANIVNSKAKIVVPAIGTAELLAKAGTT